MNPPITRSAIPPGPPRQRGRKTNIPRTEGPGDVVHTMVVVADQTVATGMTYLMEI
jgi:hypothetical protein